MGKRWSVHEKKLFTEEDSTYPELDKTWFITDATGLMFGEGHENDPVERSSVLISKTLAGTALAHVRTLLKMITNRSCANKE